MGLLLFIIIIIFIIIITIIIIKPCEDNCIAIWLRSSKID